jgi:hypothetical protein
MRTCAVACTICVAGSLSAQASPVDVAGTRGDLPIVRVADLDGHHRSSAGERANWRYRATYTRWLHNEYVRAGYPIRHPSRRIYVRW